MALLPAPARAEPVCLAGSIALVVSQNAPRTEFCNATLCTADFELAFDSDLANVGRWPLTVRFADGSHLADRYPALGDVALQCDAAGEIAASTAVGPANERMRLVWSYLGASSIDCIATLAAVNWTADFAAFQLLFAYGGSPTVYDAIASSTDAAQTSLGALRVACPTPEPAPGPDVPPPAEFSACRYPAWVWAGPRAATSEWDAVQGRHLCSASFADVLAGEGAAAALSKSVLRLARATAAVALNAAMTGVSDDDARAVLPEYGQALELLGSSYECVAGRDHGALSAVLEAFNNATSTCADDPYREAASSSNTNSTSPVSSASAKRERGYLIWAIVATVVLGVVLLMLCVVVVLAFFTRTGSILQTAAFGAEHVSDSAHTTYSRPDERRLVAAHAAAASPPPQPGRVDLSCLFSADG